MSSKGKGGVTPLSQAEYLKKYMSGGGSEDKDKKVKKKKVKAKPVQAFKIVDQDEEAKKAGLTKRKIESDDEDDKPVVVEVPKTRPEPSRVKVEDGSGWVSVSSSRSNDSSPPRRSADSSPPRRRAREDSSPPRRRAADDDESPPRRRAAGDDSSPPRRKADSSPPRRRMDADSSPPRRKAAADSSPPRRRGGEDSSPPRRKPAADSSSPRKRAAESTPEAESSARKKPTLMADGTLAGLHHGQAVKKQIDEKMRREKEKYDNMDKKLMGKDEATVYRDRRGRRLQGLEEFMRQQDGQYTATEEDNMEWGKGKVQLQQKIDEAKRLEEEAKKPFARYKDDVELDEHYKDIDRWGDPMAGLIRKRPKDDKPKYKGPAPPPNRFNIPPGYRWDGIDRSNGFEKILFQNESKRVALKEEAYLWSVSDM